MYNYIQLENVGKYVIKANQNEKNIKYGGHVLPAQHLPTTGSKDKFSADRSREVCTGSHVTKTGLETGFVAENGPNQSNFILQSGSFLNIALYHLVFDKVFSCSNY